MGLVFNIWCYFVCNVLIVKIIKVVQSSLVTQ